LKDFGICQVVLNLLVITPCVSWPGWGGSVVEVAAGKEVIDTATARAGFVCRLINSLCIGQFEKTCFIHPASRCFAPFPERSDMLFCGAKKHAKNPTAADAFMEKPVLRPHSVVRSLSGRQNTGILVYKPQFSLPMSIDRFRHRMR